MNVMGLTRRNTIIGLGALAGGAGVIGATGAFTSVEAERTVSVESSGDDNAQLALGPGNDATLVEQTEGTIEFDVGSDGINLRARTRFDNELLITNNGSNDVEIDILSDFEDDGGRSLIHGDTVVEFIVNDEGDVTSSSDTLDLPSGDSIGFDIRFNLNDDHVKTLDTGSNNTYPDESSPINTTSSADNLLNQDFGEGDGDFIVIDATDTSS